MRIKEAQHRSFQTAVDKGWWRDQINNDLPRRLKRDTLAIRRAIPEKLALVHSEISEALEEYRKPGLPGVDVESDYQDDNGKPEGFGIELADAVIRIFDLCGALGIDLESCIQKKMDYNDRRSYRHGGKRA